MADFGSFHLLCLPPGSHQSEALCYGHPQMQVIEWPLTLMTSDHGCHGRCCWCAPAPGGSVKWRADDNSQHVMHAVLWIMNIKTNWEDTPMNILFLYRNDFHLQHSSIKMINSIVMECKSCFKSQKIIIKFIIITDLNSLMFTLVQ